MLYMELKDETKLTGKPIEKISRACNSRDWKERIAHTKYKRQTKLDGWDE